MQRYDAFRKKDFGEERVTRLRLVDPVAVQYIDVLFAQAWRETKPERVDAVVRACAQIEGRDWRGLDETTRAQLLHGGGRWLVALRLAGLTDPADEHPTPDRGLGDPVWWCPTGGRRFAGTVLKHTDQGYLVTLHDHPTWRWVEQVPAGQLVDRDETPELGSHHRPVRLAHLQVRQRSHPESPATGLHGMSDDDWRACIDALRARGYCINAVVCTGGDRACNETGYYLLDTER